MSRYAVATNPLLDFGGVRVFVKSPHMVPWTMRGMVIVFGFDNPFQTFWWEAWAEEDFPHKAPFTETNLMTRIDVAEIISILEKAGFSDAVEIIAPELIVEEIDSKGPSDLQKRMISIFPAQE